jgi:hypothetical protein
MVNSQYLLPLPPHTTNPFPLIPISLVSPLTPPPPPVPN